MDKKKVWVVEYEGGDTEVCSTEGSAYRQVLRHYIELLADNLAEIRDGLDTDNVEHVYETIIDDLKDLAREHCIDGAVWMREAELVD